MTFLLLGPFSLCIGILPTAGHASPSFAHLPHCISLPGELSFQRVWSSADQITMSGLRFVDTMSGNFNFISKFTPSCQSLAWSKIPEVLLSLLPWCCSTFFHNWYMYWRVLLVSYLIPLFPKYICQLPEYMVVSPSIPSCDRAMVHAERMWCKVPLFPQRGHRQKQWSWAAKELDQGGTLNNVRLLGQTYCGTHNFNSNPFLDQYMTFYLHQQTFTDGTW